MTTTTLPTPVAVTGVEITKAKHPRIRALVRDCGTLFRYERHLDRPTTAVLVACLCPDGHGIAGLPWRGWISIDDASMTLTDVTVPVRDLGWTLDEIETLPAPADLTSAPIAPAEYGVAA